MTAPVVAPPALAEALAGVRLFDAILGPPVRGLSDQARTRMGRRRPWLLFGVVPLALCVVALLVPPAWDPAGATLWFTLTIALSYPIDETRHRELLEVVAARRREQQAGGDATEFSRAAEPA